MAIRHQLSLPEEVLLLALHDEKGTTSFGSMYGYAIAGGVVAELTLHGRFGVERVKKSTLLDVVNTAPVGDPLLDEALEQVRTAKRRASVQTWVQRFTRLRAHERLAERLRLRGVLRRHEGRFLFVFPRATYPTVDGRPELDAIERIRRAIFDDAPVDSRTAILASLAHATGLLGDLFGRKELKRRKQRIRELTELHDAGAAANAAVHAVQVATIAAVTAAVSAATAAAASG
jgi:hypothetical protein